MEHFGRVLNDNTQVMGKLESSPYALNSFLLIPLIVMCLVVLCERIVQGQFLCCVRCSQSNMNAGSAEASEEWCVVINVC